MAANDLNRNEGEGSRSAARAYDEKAERFAETNDPSALAREARKARESGAERAELDRAEKAGKERMAEEDPAVSEG